MHDYAKLYQNQDFATLVEVTASLHDLNTIRYHLIGLLGLGAHARVLAVMANTLTLLTQSLPTFLKIHREIVKNDRHLEGHERLISAYEDLPYINQESEELIAEIRRLYYRGKEAKPFDYLATLEKALKEKKEALLLDLIPQMKPIHAYQLRELIKETLRGDASQPVKGFLMLMLIDFKFDEVIALKKGLQLLQFNPIDAVNPFMDGTVENAKEELKKRIKDPSLFQVASSLMSAYVLRMVPYELDFEYYFYTALIQTAQTYLQLPINDDDFSESEKGIIAKKRHHLETILKL